MVANLSYSSLVLSGPSGSGKTELLNLLLSRDDRFRRVVTSTTRPPRPEEKNGVDYHFLDESTFLSKLEKGAFIEHAIVHQKIHYGNEWEEFEKIRSSGKIPVYILDVQGARTLRNKVNPYLVFIEVPGLPDTSELVRRLRLRGDSEESISKRMGSVPFELSQRENYDLIIINPQDSLDKAYEELSLCISLNFPK